MLTGNEYLMAWGIYLVAVIGLGAVWWRITRPLAPVRWLQNLLRVLYFALLVTPAVVVAENSARMAPAAMIWILETTLVEDAQNVSRVYAPLAVAALVGALIALGEAVLHRRGTRE
ncbi:MAG: hypothetical protein R3208_19160 [Ketobacteraceae bacterium]|nr:hypothetical protein [Ketobacteraceae bacterium]